MNLIFWSALFVLCFLSRPWRWSDRRWAALWIGVYVLLFVLFFRPDVESDGSQYYANLRSLWLDGDVNFYDDAVRRPDGYRPDYLNTLHTRGYTYNGFSIGPALFWSPFFLLAHAACRTVRWLGAEAACDGYDSLYVWTVCFVSSAFGLAGMALIYRLLRQWVQPAAAGIATGLAVLASPVIAYCYHDGTFSHAVGLFAGTLVVWQWHARRLREGPAATAPPLRETFALAVACGLAILVRWQSVLLLWFPLLDAVEHLRHALRRPDWPRRLGQLAGVNALFLLVVGAAVLPQAAVWHAQAGLWFHVPQSPEYLVGWTPEACAKMLTSRLHGLFSWHPMTLAALCCLPLLWKSQRALLIRLALVLLGQIYTNSAVADWWAGGSFGQRRFSSVLVLFAIPLAFALERLAAPGAGREPRPARMAALRLALFAALFLVAINALLLAQYLVGPLGTMGKLEPDAFLRSLVGWPLSATDAFDRLRLAMFNGPLLACVKYGQWALVPALPALPAVLGALGAYLFRTDRAPAHPRRWPEAAWLALLLAAAGILTVSSQARRFEMVNTRPDVGTSNVRDLVAARGHRYVGGYMDAAVAPGRPLEVRLDRPVIPHSLMVASHAEVDPAARPGTAVGRMTLLGRGGDRFDFELRLGVETDRPDARRSGPARRLPVVYRWNRPAWQGDGPPRIASRQWAAESILRGQYDTLRVECLPPAEALFVGGIAFRPAGAGPWPAVASPGTCVDFAAQCNAARDPDLAPLPPLLLHRGTALCPYPPRVETGRWDCIHLPADATATVRIDLERPMRIEGLVLLYAEQAATEAEVELHYHDGSRFVAALREESEELSGLGGQLLVATVRPDRSYLSATALELHGGGLTVLAISAAGLSS